jgi:Asp-tRNA(Asn)/Glu-tRNA(Gln) amidotransferase A subunit family amidase
VREFLGRHDLWLTPTAATPPFPVEHPHVLEINGRPVGKTMQRSFLTYAVSVLGLPAISIPCGMTRAGLPVGLQIIGPRRGEAAVLRAAAAFEAAAPWADRIPPSPGPAESRRTRRAVSCRILVDGSGTARAAACARRPPGKERASWPG